MNEDKATRYNRLRRQAGVASVVWGVLLLLGLVLSGGSLAMRDAAEGLASVLVGEARLRAASVAIYTVLLTLLSEVGDHSVTLGGLTGPPVCTNDASGYPIECVAPIGTSTTESGSGSVRDNGTGATGTLAVACTVMYAGTQTTYVGRSGRADDHRYIAVHQKLVPGGPLNGPA